jgi:ABC-type transport system involved in multi-copper enzyme maturation permease subunit
VNRTVIEETVRRHVTNLAYLVFLAFLAIVAFGVATFNQPGSAWPSLVTLLAIITGAGVIGPEFSSGTLQLILVKPVNRAVYLVSRVTGVAIAVWLAALVAAICELAGRALWGDGGVQAKAIGSTLLNSFVDTILCIALLALLGSLTRAYFNAAIYVVAMMGISVTGGILGMIRQSNTAIGRFLTAFPGIQRALDVVDHNLFPELSPRLDTGWMLMVLSNAALALLLACLAFRRREVPYGAD